MRRVAIVFTCVFAIATLALAQSTNAPKRKKVPTGTGRAGVVSVTAPSRVSLPRSIAGDLSEGIHCVIGELMNVHPLGLIPGGLVIEVDFESGEESDPIATMSSIQYKDGQAGGERMNSDDEGGDLNPRFRITKDYDANWVLTVGTADGGVACYSYKVTIR